jgi:hypothetical protein
VPEAVAPESGTPGSGAEDVPVDETSEVASDGEPTEVAPEDQPAEAAPEAEAEEAKSE